MTLWQQYVKKWENGCGSELCGGSDGLGHGVRVCLARGQVPCDMLLVGEAPGESENVLGKPFIGPAGRLLDRIVEDAISESGKQVRWCCSNVVGCIPREEDGSKISVPPDAAVRQCAPRLQGFIDLCKPKLVVAVGNVAEDWLNRRTYPPKKKGDNIFRLMKDAQPMYNLHGATLVSIQHPAFILRANLAQRGLLAQRCVVTLATALEEVMG